jgi:electron transfer flavoprotein alpha subunit
MKKFEDVVVLNTGKFGGEYKFSDFKDMWVVIETVKGHARPVGLELLNPGRRMATDMGEKLVAVIIGDKLEPAINATKAMGVDKIIVVEGEEYWDYSTDAYTNAMVKLIEDFKPSCILQGATMNGRDLGPRIAARILTGLTADCTQLDYDKEARCVAWTRPAFGGNIMATIYCPDTRPEIGTCRPGVFKKAVPDVVTDPEIVRVDFSVPKEDIRTKIVKVIHEVAENINLEEAEIIVTGGRGLGKAENFSYIRDLAEVLGGTVGASRAAVDAGWIPHAHQVGQTGKTVGPKIYFACGVSGAIQHLAGMSGSDVVVAINKDPKANIHYYADYSIIGNLIDVIPPLVQEIKSLRSK